MKSIKLLDVIKRLHNVQANYVPKHTPLRNEDVNLLREFITKSEKIVVLTGAGISTESGIPDYRSDEVGLYARTNHKPVQYQEFLKHPLIRKRYWARNYVGWERFSKCQPNATHMAIKNMERIGKVSTVVTQNVDNLHTKAGSENVIELHGSAFRVNCLECEATYNRFYIQECLAKCNPDLQHLGRMIRPDGDVEIPQDAIENFNPPFCESCSGILKPDIVFFGDNVPRNRVDDVITSVTESDSLLVLGSSLTVFSSYRIILQALEENKNICIVNIGPTRADELVELKISARCGDILPKIVDCS